jgi:dihydropteroate synthase
LGVVNITPNSFSDGGLHLHESKLLETFTKFLNTPNLIIDVGFESTAPMNSAISEAEEKARFHYFLNFLKKNPEIPLKALSIDTYKIENFKYFYNEIKKLYPQVEIIFNDVSGVLDSDLEGVLTAYKDIKYIFTSTRIPDRAHVLDHMKYLSKTTNSMIIETSECFKKTYHWLLERNLIDRVLFDPGFGFSKTYEENWELIENFQELELLLLNDNIKIPWVIGLSKKSFLRKKCEKSPDVMASAEELHLKTLKQLLANTNNEIYFRVHHILSLT